MRGGAFPKQKQTHLGFHHSGARKFRMVDERLGGFDR